MTIGSGEGGMQRGCSKYISGYNGKTRILCRCVFHRRCITPALLAALCCPICTYDAEDEEVGEFGRAAAGLLDGAGGAPAQPQPQDGAVGGAGVDQGRQWIRFQLQTDSGEVMARMSDVLTLMGRGVSPALKSFVCDL